MKTQKEKDIDAWADILEKVMHWPLSITTQNDIRKIMDISTKQLKRLRDAWPSFDYVLDKLIDRNKRIAKQKRDAQ